MPNLKPDIISPTDEEDKAINKGIAQDPDAREMTDEEFKNAKPFGEVFPEIVKAQQEGKLTTRRVGRPKADVTKERVTIRLSPEVTEYFRSTGKGWQTRLDNALKEYVQSHQ